MKFNTCLILLLFVSVSSLTLRELFSDTELGELCREVQYERKSTDLSFSEYTNQVAGRGNDTLDFFERLLVDPSDIEITLIAKKIGFYFFIFFIALCVFLSWIIFGCCCICRCGLFRKRHSDKGPLFKIIVSGLFGVLIITGFVALGLSLSVGGYFEGSICSFFDFFEHTLDGDGQTSQTSKWVGLKGIGAELDNTFQQINSILATLSNDANTFETNFNTNSTEVQRLLDSTVETNIRDPSDPTQLIETDYSQTFSESLDVINDKYIQIRDTLEEGIYSLKTKLDKVHVIDDEFEDIKAQLTNKADEFSREVDNFSEKFSPVFKIIHENVSNDTFAIFKIIYGLFITFAIIGLGIFLLHTLSAKIRCRYFVNLLWVILCLFIVGSLIIASFLGMIGTISGEVIKFLPHLFSESFLSQSDFKQQFGDFTEITPLLNVCLEGNGNFIQKIGLDLEIEGADSTITESETQINEFMNQLDENSKIQELETLITKIQTYRGDCSTAFSTVNPNKFTEVLENLNSKFTTDYDDVFITKIEECPEGKTYLAPSQSRSPSGSYCLIACEWPLAQIEQTYPLASELIAAFRSFSAFIEDHERVTGNMLTITSGLDTILNSIKVAGYAFGDQVKSSLTTFKSYYDLTRDDEEAIGNKLNCSFIKNDLITFINQLFHGFSTTVIQISTSSIICSFVAYFAAILLIIYINSSYHDDRESGNITGDNKMELIQKGNW